MSLEIINARSDPSPGGPPAYRQKVTSYNRTAKTEAQQRSFFENYVKVGTITGAARRAGIDPAYHYKWLETDPDYPARFKLTHLQASEALVEEGRRRALEGVEEPTGWYRGEPGGFVKRYSDSLLIFLIKGAFPDIYKDRHEHTGKNGGPIEVSSTVTIEQFPVWLKQAIVVISSGIQIDPEVERVLMSHFEQKFLEAEKVVGKGTTEWQDEARGLESYHSESIGGETVVEMVAESVVELEPTQPLQADPTSIEPEQSRPDWRPAKRERVTLDMDDI